MSIPLLPQPAHIRLKRGTFHLPGALPVFFEPLSRLPHEPLPSLLTALRNAGCHPVPDCMAHYGAGKTRHILLECQDAGDREDYRIEINPDRIEVWGAGRPGFFYAIQTLIQIIRARAPDLPLLDIVDRPVFRHRGYYYDISRGKVPKMETL